MNDPETNSTLDNLERLKHTNNQPVLVDIRHMCLISIRGEDSKSFLQGQFSNDITRIQGSAGQLNAYCTPKGRAVSIFQLFEQSAQYWMLIPADIEESLLKRLRMFVMRAKVRFHTMPENQIIGGIGEFEDTRDSGLLVIKPKGDIKRFIIVSTEGEEKISDIRESYPCLDEGDSWKLVDIQSGIPQVYSSTSENFIPQNVNLDITDGVNFRKGCYPGQEIVARLKYLGKSKQRMAIGTINLSSADTIKSVEPGDEIFSTERPDQKSGVVVDAVHVSNNCFWVSAVVPVTHIGKVGLHLGTATGPVFTQTELPYELTEQ